MIRTIAIKHNHEIVSNLPLESLMNKSIQYFWVDFNKPTDEETKQLSRFFKFHPLAIVNCMNQLQRPMVDFYDEYAFFVLHALKQESIKAEEVDLFVGERFVVTFHFDRLKEIDEVWENELNASTKKDRDPYYFLHLILDNLVDSYFEPIYQIEDELDEIENNTQRRSMRTLMNRLFATRSDLLELRHIILPTRDLLYQFLTSTWLAENQDWRAYYTDVYYHLLKLAEMIESNREITADIRDSHLSINTYRMNEAMMTLTVIATIFMPLTFISGVYGMNFTFIPGVNWHYGAYYVLGFMAAVAILMYFWFKHKGWFDK